MSSLKPEQLSSRNSNEIELSAHEAVRVSEHLLEYCDTVLGLVPELHRVVRGGEGFLHVIFDAQQLEYDDDPSVPFLPSYRYPRYNSYVLKLKKMDSH